jgi:uncharacterized membrane protein
MDTMLLPVHILAGAVGLISGAVALYAVKGATVHRRSGTVFVFAMLAMSLAGATIAAVRQQEANIVAGLLTAYLVFTGLTTLRPVRSGERRVAVGTMLAALGLGVASLSIALDAMLNGDGTLDGVPAPMVMVFGSVALIGGVSDFRMLRAGGIKGTRRVARHLWRMCFALWIGSASFFLGQSDEIPEPLRIMPLLATLAFLPLVLMFYRLWRVRVRKSWQRTTTAREPGTVTSLSAG